MTAFYIENVNNTLRKTMRLFIIRCFSMLLSRCSLFVVIFTVFFFPEHLDKSGIVIHTDVQRHQLKKQISS